MNKNHAKVLWITRTAVFIALLIALQWATGPLGNQIITGSCVNAVLAIAALLGGVWSAVVVAAVSPFFAFLLKIGPQLIQVIPFIALGNLVYVLLIAGIAHLGKKSVVAGAIGVVVGAAAKLAALYGGIVKLLVPAMGEAIPAKQAAMFATMFSWPQLITALIGGAVALVIFVPLKKAIKQ